MKYNSSNKPLVCMQTQSTCYKGTSKMTIKGILWHSTGANNSSLKRYVQPSDTKPAADTYSKEKWLELLGKNKNGNDWNHKKRSAGLNCWIGKLADGTVTTVQTMPWDYKPWGCGSGARGSCNNGWIQFEICEDDLKNKDYFNTVYREACELTAYLCKLYNINPNGSVSYKGKSVPTILCHKDSYKLGLGSGHGDVYHWFNKYGKSMDSVRQDVAILLKGDPFPLQSSDSATSSTATESDSSSVLDTILIRNVSVLDTSATCAEIELSTNDTFKSYSWKYNIAALVDTDKPVSKTFSVTSSSTTLKITSLQPSTAYTLEIYAEDTFKNVIKSPSIMLFTLQDTPDKVENVDFDFSTKTVSFTPITSWGDDASPDRGYRISIAINGEEIIFHDSMLRSDSKIVKELSDLLSKAHLTVENTLQVGVQPWIIDCSGNKVLSGARPTYSKPIYLSYPLTKIDKLFVDQKTEHKQAIIYSQVY